MVRAAFLALAVIMAPLWGSLASAMPPSVVHAADAVSGEAVCADHMPAGKPTGGGADHRSDSCALACAVPAVPAATLEPTTVPLHFAAVSWPQPAGVSPDRLDWPPPLRPPSL